MKRRQSILLFLIFTYVCFFTGNTYSARYLPLRVVTHLLPISLLGAWLVGLIRNRKGFAKTRLDQPILAWLGVALVASFAGLCPRFSLERVCRHLAYALSFYALVELQSRGREVIAFRALFLTGAVVCLAGLIEWISWYLGLSFLPGTTVGWPAIRGQETLIPPVLHRLNATLGGSTPLAAFLAVLIPPAIGWVVTTKRPQMRWALSLWLAVALLVEVLTLSRGGILALGVSLPLMGLGWIAAQPRWQKALKQWFQGRSRWKFWGVFLTLLAMAVVVGAFWFSHSFTGRRGSTAHRFTLWNVALDTLRASPVLGVGPANFGRALLLQNDNALPRKQIQTAHNAYLNAAAEVGLAGLLVGAWLLSAIVRGWIANWKDAPSDRRLRMTAWGAALVGLAAQLLVDTFTAPANWLPVLVLGAFVSAQGRARRPTRLPRGKVWGPVAALSTLLLSTAWLGWTDVAQYHFERSTQLMRRADFEQASQESQRAQAMDRGLSLYTFQHAHIQALRSTANGASSIADQAITHYRAGLSTDPVWGKQSANLASLLWKQGNRTEAIEWMERTTAADQHPDYLLNLGLFYERIGAEEEAWESYGRTLANSPARAGSGFWHANPARAEAWPKIIQQAEHIITQKRNAEALFRFHAKVALAKADYGQVEQVADSILEAHPDSPEGYTWLARYLLGQQRADDALLAAQQAAKIAPKSSVALALRGCARWQAEKDPNAIDDLRKALFISPGTQDAHICLGQIYEEQGKLDAAIESYSRALSGRAIDQDVEMTLYDRRATFEMLPGLVRVRMGEHTAAPWLRVATLYEQMERCEDAQAVYRALLAEDEYLEIARKRLEALPCHADSER
jgi:tetratricopeptide (TPR) repeat protein